MSQPMAGPRTGVEVHTGFFPLAFFLFFCTPVTEINGHPDRKYWGTKFYDLPPGQYHFTISFPYIFMAKCGRADAPITLRPGEVRRINYFMWPWMFAPGQISVT